MCQVKKKKKEERTILSERCLAVNQRARYKPWQASQLAVGVAWSDTAPTPPAHHIKEAAAGTQTELQQLALYQTVLTGGLRGVLQVQIYGSKHRNEPFQ